jgi:hypothetical protein
MDEDAVFWVDEQEGELVFQDEEGEERYIIEEELDLDGNKYFIIVPVEMIDDEDADAMVLKLIRDGDEEVLTMIEDDDEFERVREAYINIIGADEDYDEDE